MGDWTKREYAELMPPRADGPWLAARFVAGLVPDLGLPVDVPHLYIDVNHWIGLTRARLRRPGSEEYAAVLERLRTAVKQKAIAIPVSGAHWMEISNIADPQQRAHIAVTVDRLSRWVAINDRAALITDQLTAAIARWRGLPVPALADDDIWGRGLNFAFGGGPGGMTVTGPPEARAVLFAEGLPLVKRIERITGQGWTYADRGRSGPDMAERAMWESAEFTMFRGPDDDALDELRANGYQPEVARDGIKGITEREAELTRLLKLEENKRYRLDDIVAARLWVWELRDIAPVAAVACGVDPGEILDGGKDVMTALLMDMPTMVVEFALRRANWANGDYTWTTNDIHDLAHLGVAIPYCDVTWTEKHATAVLNAAHVPSKFGTKVVSKFDDLHAALDEIVG